MIHFDHHYSFDLLFSSLQIMSNCVRSIFTFLSLIDKTNLLLTRSLCLSSNFKENGAPTFNISGFSFCSFFQCSGTQR